MFLYIGLIANAFALAHTLYVRKKNTASEDVFGIAERILIVFVVICGSPITSLVYFIGWHSRFPKRTQYVGWLVVLYVSIAVFLIFQNELP